MRSFRLRSRWSVLVVASLLSACALQPVTPDDADVLAQRSQPLPVQAKVDETAMLPLLGYYQMLQRMSPQELLRERNVLTAVRQTPSTQVRLSMVLGLGRGPADLARAQNLLDGVLKSGAADAASLHSLARMLSSQYQERLKLDQERNRLEQQNDKVGQQLKESQRHADELQQKLDAMANIERSIPVRPTPGAILPGSQR